MKRSKYTFNTYIKLKVVLEAFRNRVGDLE